VPRGKSRQSAPVVSLTPHPVESSPKILSKLCHFSVKLQHFPSSTLSATRRNPHAIRSAVPRWPGKFTNIIDQIRWKPIHLLHRDLCALSSFRASDSYPNGGGCHHWRPSLRSVPVDASVYRSSNYAHRQRVRPSRHRPCSGAKSCKSVHSRPSTFTAAFR
jgi:hypothetical protein